jgi:hypothetical protein
MYLLITPSIAQLWRLYVGGSSATCLMSDYTFAERMGAEVASGHLKVHQSLSVLMKKNSTRNVLKIFILIGTIEQLAFPTENSSVT